MSLRQNLLVRWNRRFVSNDKSREKMLLNKHMYMRLTMSCPQDAPSLFHNRMFGCTYIRGNQFLFDSQIYTCTPKHIINITCTYVYTYIHIYKYIYIHRFITHHDLTQYIHIYTQMKIYTHMYTYMHTHSRIHTDIHMYTYRHIRIDLCTHLYTNIGLVIRVFILKVRIPTKAKDPNLVIRLSLFFHSWESNLMFLNPIRIFPHNCLFRFQR